MNKINILTISILLLSSAILHADSLSAMNKPPISIEKALELVRQYSQKEGLDKGRHIQRIWWIEANDSYNSRWVLAFAPTKFLSEKASDKAIDWKLISIYSDGSIKIGNENRKSSEENEKIISPPEDK